MYKGSARHNNHRHELAAEYQVREAEEEQARDLRQWLKELRNRVNRLKIGQELVGRVQGPTTPPVQVDVDGLVVLLRTGKVKPRQVVTVIVDRKEPTGRGIPRVIVRLKDPKLG